MKIAYSFGIIDLLHVGHINVLQEARRQSDRHIFGLVGDEAAREWTGNLLSSYAERLRVLEQVSCIDEIVFQKTFDPTENLRQLHDQYPNAEITLYHGNNWGVLPAEEYLRGIGGHIVLSQYYEKFSPENIRRLLSVEADLSRKRVSNLISTKADTLLALQDRLKRSRIEPIYVVTAGGFQKDCTGVLEEIGRRYAGKRIVVRSSASNEDSLQSSNAGHYDSTLNVRADEPLEVERAIESVQASYRRDGLCGAEEQVLIQTQTENPAVSGVIFTRDLQRNRPYYLINYDDSGSTDSVTSGSGGRSLYISRDTQEDALPPVWRKLVGAVQEIERILDGMILDVEFAVTQDGDVVIFQVRPLAANYRFFREFDDKTFFDHKRQVKESVRTRPGGLDGEAMLFSDMAFWNPSEIVGTHPHELDYSLYREIITKRAWNEGLVPMGYRRVERELMVRFSGKPYISLDYAFESLIPAALPDELARKLVRFYKQELQKDLTAHDKIEFEIVCSCYDFSTEEKMAGFLEAGLYVEECQALREALKELTVKAVQQYFQVLHQDEQSLERLEHSRSRIQWKLHCQEGNTTALLNYFTTLLDDLKRYGTPQFARQARYAFIARSLCRSLVERGYVTVEQMDEFMLSIETVATEFARDMERYLDGGLSREEFCEKYGHLRSGTYDIRSDRYDQLTFPVRPKQGAKEGRSAPQGHTLPEQALLLALTEADFGAITPEYLTRFMRTAFEQRERFKYEFTKSLSLALEILRMAGKNLNISAHELSHLQVADILAAEYYEEWEDLLSFWRALIHQHKGNRWRDALLVLPDVITAAGDVDVVCMQEARPNFITDKSAEGLTAAPEKMGCGDLTGRIVLLEKADPGFDWIFSQEIAGLITCYGGAASHMAIRCAEFGIPAAIGCGTKIYAYVSGLEAILLDAKRGKIMRADL